KAAVRVGTCLLGLRETLPPLRPAQLNVVFYGFLRGLVDGRLEVDRDSRRGRDFVALENDSCQPRGLSKSRSDCPVLATLEVVHEDLAGGISVDLHDEGLVARNQSFKDATIRRPLFALANCEELGRIARVAKVRLQTIGIDRLIRLIAADGEVTGR